jgi:hypothetical protein
MLQLQNPKTIYICTIALSVSPRPCFIGPIRNGARETYPHSRQYRDWTLPYRTDEPKQLGISRRALGKLFAIRTMYGDLAWDHRKSNHDEPILVCHCGQDKSPQHLVHCKSARRLFHRWPVRPHWPPADKRKELMYLHQLLNSPDDFTEFVQLYVGVGRESEAA